MTTAPTAPVKLKGQELLDYVKANADQLRDDVVKGAGYYSMVERDEKQEDGSTKKVTVPSLQYTAFSEAFMEASGVVLKRPNPVRTPGSGEGKGKAATFRLIVGTKGVLPIGAAYTSKAGLEPGTYVLVSFEEGGVSVEADPDQRSPENGGGTHTTNANGAIGRYNTDEAIVEPSNGKSAKASKTLVAA